MNVEPVPARPATADLRAAVQKILAKRRGLATRRSMLVAVSGIDGSGKGHLASRIVSDVKREGIRAIAINADAWLHLPSRRFSNERPAAHFYHHAFRFREMFDRLILPLKEKRSISIEADLVTETATSYYRHTYTFQDVDVIVLEGIFLLKRPFLEYYDLAVWVDCSFETALGRALRRGQEGLPQEETIRAYETIYFPAQRIHLALDDPMAAADVVLNNDPQTAPRGSLITPHRQ